MQGSTAAAAAGLVMPAIATLSSRVIRIMGLNPSPMTLEGSNTYLVGTGTDRLLIDSGEGVPGYEDLLHQAVTAESTRLGCPVRVSTLLLTHWHEDHIGGVDAVRQMFPHVQLLKQPSQYTRTRVDGLCTSPPCEIAVEGATLQLLHTPGHTDDHICAFLKEERALFTGDTILGTGSSVFSCFKDYMHSLEVLKDLKPKRLYAGHGPVVEDGTGRIEETIRHRNLREQQVLQVLRDHTLKLRNSSATITTATTPVNRGEEGDAVEKGLNIREIVEIIYTTTPESLKMAAGTNVFHHVKKLTNEGTAVLRHAPVDLLTFLKDATDYTTFGEGADMDTEMIHRILTEFHVAAAEAPPSA